MIKKKQSLKFKLLLYYLLIQIILFALFGAILVYMLKESVKDRIETNLRVIILDVKDDIIEHHKNMGKLSLEKEIEEFQIKPLFIKIVSGETVIQSNNFPKDIPLNFNITDDKIYFNIINHKAVSTLKFNYNETVYLIQLSTSPKHLAELFPNLKYIFMFLIPIVLLFAVILGNILISKSFTPIEKLLNEIQKIGAKNLSKRVTLNNSKDEVDQIAYEINKLLQRVEKSYEHISQFTSDASHELKTPVTRIRGEIEVLLKEERETEEYKTTLHSILHEILNIQDMINDLLLLAKVDNDYLLDEDVYLDEIIFDVINELQLVQKQKNITILTDIKEPLTIKGNEKFLKIALKNLLENSIFYSNINSKVEVKLINTNGAYSLVIKDYGIGMNEKDLHNIFKKFYRSDSSRSKNTGGFGLGMSIVQKICELHHMNISVNSTPNGGTEFILEFDNSFLA